MICVPIPVVKPEVWERVKRMKDRIGPGGVSEVFRCDYG